MALRHDGSKSYTSHLSLAGRVLYGCETVEPAQAVPHVETRACDAWRRSMAALRRICVDSGALEALDAAGDRCAVPVVRTSAFSTT